MSKKMALEWLKAATDDLNVIIEIRDNESLTHIAAFHAQQSVEKSFKAIFECKDKTVPKKHDLVILYNLTSTFMKIEDVDILDTLNSLYIDSRYPGDLGLLPDGKPTLVDAEEFYDFAKKVYDKVKIIIESST